MPYTDQIALFSFDHRWLFGDGTHGEDGHLRLVDDRGAHNVSKRSNIREGERTTLRIVREQLVVARTICEIVNGFTQTYQAQLVGVFDNWYNEVSRGQGGCHSDIDLALFDNLRPVDRNVDHR